MAKPSGKYAINGDRGDNVIDGSSYSSSLQSAGLSINGNAGNDTIHGGSGADILSGGDGNDILFGDLADLKGSIGSVVWDGGKGIDTLDLSLVASAPGTGLYVTVDYGAPNGSSQIYTDLVRNNSSVFVPEPAVYSSSYANVLQGFENFNLGSGNDYIWLSSFAVNNIVHGGDGDDQINAGAGNDTVYGDAGNDIVDGGWGSDVLYGGGGSDVFAWQGSVVGQYDRDVVKDFDFDRSDGTYDQVWLWSGYTLTWDQSSPNLLRGLLSNSSGVTWGDVSFEGMTLAQSALVEIHHIDPATGMPTG